MVIDFLGVSKKEQEELQAFFDAIIQADAEKDAGAMIAFLAPSAMVEIEGMGLLDRRACEVSIRSQVRDKAESRMDYPTLYVQLKDGVYHVEGTYQGWSGGRLDYEGSLEMRLVKEGGRFLIAYEKMIPSLHGGKSV